MNGMENPKVTKGDKVLLIQSNNGLSHYNGRIFEVTQGTTGTNKFIKVKLVDEPNSQNIWTFYFDRSPSDVYVLADRKSMAEYHKKKVKELKEQIKEHEREAKYYEDYESDEEYVAEKIHKLMNSESKQAMTEILKELRRSNYL